MEANQTTYASSITSAMAITPEQEQIVRNREAARSELDLMHQQISLYEAKTTRTR